MELLKALDKITGGEWFITGSRGYGAHTDSSDLDICIPIWHHPEDVWQLLLTYGFEVSGEVVKSEYWNGQKAILKKSPSDIPTNNPYIPLELNLIPLHPNSFISWAMTTTQMRSWWKYLQITGSHKHITKEMRVHQFEVRESLNRISFPPIESPQHSMVHFESIWKPLQGGLEKPEEKEIPF